MVFMSARMCSAAHGKFASITSTYSLNTTKPTLVCSCLLRSPLRNVELLMRQLETNLPEAKKNQLNCFGSRCSVPSGLRSCVPSEKSAAKANGKICRNPQLHPGMRRALDIGGG